MAFAANSAGSLSAVQPALPATTPPETEPQGGPVKIRWFRRWSWRRWLLLGCMAAVLALPIVNVLLLLPWPKQKLANAAGRVLGVPLSVQRVSIWPWSGVRLLDVRLGQSKDPVGSSYLAFQSMRIHPRWRSLMTRTWHIDRVEIHQFDLVGQSLLGPGPTSLLPDGATPQPLPQNQSPDSGGSDSPAFEDTVPPSGEPGTPADGAAAPAAPSGPDRTPTGPPRIRPPRLEVGEILLSTGSIRVIVPGGDEFVLMQVSDVALTLNTGADNSPGRMTIGRVEWPGGWSSSGIEADVLLRPGPIIGMEGRRPEAEGLAWRLESQPAKPGLPFALEILAQDVQLAELFDRLPPWIAAQPSWLNGRATILGFATQPSSIRTVMRWRIENLKLLADDLLRNHLGGQEGGRLDQIDLQSAGLDLAMGGGALEVGDLFLKTPDGIGRTRFAVIPDGRLAGALRIYATVELRDMITANLANAPWAAFEPTSWQATEIQLGGSWREPIMRFAGQPDNSWWSPLELLRSMSMAEEAVAKPNP